jgi:transposase
MHMLAALDLATGRLFYRIRSRKRSIEFLDLLKVLRRRWPGEKLYLICDNFSPHRHPRVRAWCTANQVELVFLPTYASWLNWIEAEFAALLLRAQRYRPSQPPRTRRRDRRLHPLAQPRSQTENDLRPELKNPPSRLPDQGRVTRVCKKFGVTPDQGAAPDD